MKTNQNENEELRAKCSQEIKNQRAKFWLIPTIVGGIIAVAATVGFYFSIVYMFVNYSPEKAMNDSGGLFEGENLILTSIFILLCISTFLTGIFYLLALRPPSNNDIEARLRKSK
ncbi:MAG: hypothetical protein ACM3PZ_03255 [Bacillota bacterium]